MRDPIDKFALLAGLLAATAKLIEAVVKVWPICIRVIRFIKNRVRDRFFGGKP